MKTIKFLILAWFFSFLLFLAGDSSFAAVTIPWTSEISGSSMSISSSWNIFSDIRNVGFRLLGYIKTLLSAVLVIFIVYTGGMMIMSMGSDEEKLSSAKRQLWYFLIALLFINIPWAIFNAFRKNNTTSIGNFNGDSFTDISTESSDNIFFNVFSFTNTFSGRIVFFLEIMIFLSAIVMLTLAGISVLTSRGREDNLKEAKSKFVYTILALVFVGIVEGWKRVAFLGDLSEWQDLFETLANLALFFAAPVAIFFLSMAGYYFITSAWDDEKIKKAKSIIINTLLATLILLAGYTFLLDLSGLF